MKIALDLDEVTVDFISAMIREFNHRYGKNISKEDITNFSLTKSMNSEKEIIDKIIDDIYGTEIHSSLVPVDGSKESINYLLEKNEIFIVTSRPSKHKESTEKWINTHFPNNKFHIIFSSSPQISDKIKSKAEICIDNKISLIFEDNPDYAIECANKNIKVILFDQPWNQDISHKNMIRVKGWSEATSAFREIENKDKL
jgi:uncharacterized HAD superfamily protein